jgi:mRNA interferase MazF
VKLTLGAVVLAVLDPTFGHEQQAIRPCVVVTDTEVLQDQRFPMLCVVPITRTPGEGALYPALSPGQSGLRAQSYALVDQVRSLDKRRVTRVFGRISQEEMSTIEEGLRLFLGLH